ncbi:MAG TPA: hypothetical protein VGB77_02135 [Abditibacteriaceae bacterium]|jgi:hypothetical protein
MRSLLLLGSLFCWIVPGHPCAWDSDTLAAEAKGLPDVVQIITGRFERNPPLYYQMRLQRVTQTLKKQPNKFELYDDAGVACDRLGRGKEAIAWMNRKRGFLDKRGFNKATKEHWYRYHANLGTFLAHEWLRSGANRRNIKPMQEGRDHIKRAIQINPNAHFGREKYQLEAMQWMLRNPVVKWIDEFPSFFEVGDEDENSAEAAKGISGLIVLGGGWESIDVFHALHNALASRAAPVAYLAAVRSQELARQGKRSLCFGAPTGEALAQLLKPKQFPLMLYEDRYPELQKQYQKLRAEAEEFHQRRTAYMMERLNAGRHPDTDATFWNEWHDAGPPVIDDVYVEPGVRFIQGLIALLVALVLLCIGGLYWWIKRRRAAKSALTAP